MLCYCFFRSLEIINTDNKNAYTALEANLKKVEGERDLANQSFTKIKEERSQLSSEIKVKLTSSSMFSVVTHFFRN